MDIDGVLIAVPTQLTCFREGEGRGRQGKYMQSLVDLPLSQRILLNSQDCSKSLKGYADPLDAC